MKCIAPPFIPCFWALFIVGCAYKDQLPPVSALPSQPFSISGTVADTNGPLPDITVELFRNGLKGTGQEGRFRFDDLSAGSYTLTPSKPGVVFTPPTRTATLIDPTGTSAITTDELRIELADTATPIQRGIRSYLLLEPTPGCPEMTTINKALVCSISGSTRPTSRIFISSSRPSSKGNWGASSVAAEILTALNAAELAPAELHVANEPFKDHQRMLLPEEMIVSRAVRVTLEQQGE